MRRSFMPRHCLTFVGWMVATGDLHNAVTIAIAVLIITCPCALGLAVPIVQVMAAQRLFENGIMVKDGSAIERLAEIDAVIFDKTGTLTSAVPRLVPAEHVDGASLSLAAALASHSRHPYSRALVEAAAGLTPSPVVFDDITEQAGLRAAGAIGRDGLSVGETVVGARRARNRLSELRRVVLTRNGQLMTGFRFEDTLRTDAAVAVAKLKQDGLPVEIVSGDRKEPVGLVATALGVPYRSGVMPGEKVARIKSLAAAGQKVLMVGDGLNDTPALGAAHASMAPASASDVGRCAADFVFLRQSLLAIPLAVSVAREARRLIRQNFALAVAYNVVAVPIAIMGHVTPLIAAVAMSASSILVVANALRLEAPAKDRGQRCRRTPFRPQPCWRPPNEGLLLPDTDRARSRPRGPRGVHVVAQDRAVRRSGRGGRTHPAGRNRRSDPDDQAGAVMPAAMHGISGCSLPSSWPGLCRPSTP